MHPAFGTEAPPLVAFSEPADSAAVGVRSLDQQLEDVALQHVEERSILRKFICTARHVAQHMGINNDAWTVRDIGALADIEVDTIHRDSALGLALWVAWLQTTAQFMPRSKLKYQSLTEFLAVYVCFVSYDQSMQEHLMHVANWMAYLLSKIPARKNKGFVLQVIPKLLEGWQARYITGSGQSRATEDRVKIYEVEGDIAPIQRMKPPKRGRLEKKRKRMMKNAEKRSRASVGKASLTERGTAGACPLATPHTAIGRSRKRTKGPIMDNSATPMYSLVSSALDETSPPYSASSLRLSFTSASPSPPVKPSYMNLSQSGAATTISGGDLVTERSNQLDNHAANHDGLEYNEIFFPALAAEPARLSEGGTSADYSFDPEPAFGSVIDKDLFNEDFCDFPFVGLHGDTDFSLLFENTPWATPISVSDR